MAYVVVNSKFTPFTYDELVKPLVDYTTAYEKQEAAYNKLLDDAGAVEAFINKDNAPTSWGVYSKFRDKLRAQADELATKGLSSKLRRDLMNSGADYRSEVAPIVAAINRRQEAIKTFNSSPAGKSGTYIGKKPSDTSVDDWLGGNTPDIYGVNGDDISDYVKSEVEAASDRNYQIFKRNGYNVTKVGASQEETAALIQALRTGGSFNNDTQQGQYLNRVLNDLRNTVVANAQTTFGFNRFLAYDENNNPIATADSDKFMKAIYHGIMSGMKGSEKQDVNSYDLAGYNHQLRTQEQWLDFYMKQPGFKGFDKSGKPIFAPQSPNAGEVMRDHIAEYHGSKSLQHQEYANPITGKASAIFTDDQGNVQPVKMPDGEVYTDMLQIYRHLSNLKKEYNKLNREAINNSKSVNPNDSTQVEQLRQQGKKRQELKSIIDEYEKTFGDRLMSDGDYRKMKNLYGFTNDDFTFSDIKSIADSSRDYKTYSYNQFTIADKGGSPKLLGDIHNDINDSIGRNGTAALRKTTNGIDDAGKLSPTEIFRLKEEISRAFVSPENILTYADRSYIVVQVPSTTDSEGNKVGDDFMVLVPAHYLNNAALNDINSAKVIYNKYTGTVLPSNRKGLDSGMNSMVSEIRSDYNDNIPGRKEEGSSKLQ